jgi:hypothetical protein
MGARYGARRGEARQLEIERPLDLALRRGAMDRRSAAEWQSELDRWARPDNVAR